MTRFALHPDLSSALARHFRENHRVLFEEARPVSSNPPQATKSFTHQGHEYIIKRYPETGPRGWLRAWLGATRAMNSFKRARELAAQDIRTPRHLFVACHLGLTTATSFLIMEKSEGEQLFAMIFDEPKRAIPEEILANVARLTLRMHRSGLTHGDLHSRNLLVLNDQSVEIIDLDGMDTRTRRQKKDLARLLNSFHRRPKLQSRLRTLLEQTRT